MQSHQFTTATSEGKTLSKGLTPMIGSSLNLRILLKIRRSGEPQSHSSHIQQDGHGAEVDTWGVAHYMCRLLEVINNRQYVEQMANRCKEDTTLTAEMALRGNEVGTALHHCNIFIFGAASKTTLLDGGCWRRNRIHPIAFVETET